MKKLQLQLLKVFNAVLSGLLVILGFNSCEFTGGTEYGTPRAVFHDSQVCDMPAPTYVKILSRAIFTRTTLMMYGKTGTKYSATGHGRKLACVPDAASSDIAKEMGCISGTRKQENYHFAI